MSVRMTVYFDGSFWVGVLERAEPDGTGDENVRAARVVFGAEPTDVQLYEYLRHAGLDLLNRAAASPAVPGGRAAARPMNPKRAARMARREAARVAASGTGTAAQEAVKREIVERKARAAGERRAEDDRRAGERRRRTRRRRAERRRGR